MDTVQIVSKSTIRPGNGYNGDEFHRRIELTPFDLFLLPHTHTQRGLLFDKPASPIAFVEHLKTALSRALDIFFPFAGRLEVIGGDDLASFLIDCNGKGALFVHAIAESVMASDVLAEPVAVREEIFSSFFLMSGVPNCEAAVSELPLLALQVTELRDGVFLAYSYNHVVTDDTGFWHFLNVWSEISRCLNELTPRRLCFRFPVFGREFLYGLVDLPLRIPLFRERIHRGVSQPTTGTVRSQNFRFSKEKIAELKAKANAAEPGINIISSLQALMAHLWVCVTRSRGLNPEAEVTKVVAVGLRQRLQPPLPNEYFGNAVRTVVVNTTAGELLEHGMGWAARQMNSAIATQTPSEVDKFLQESCQQLMNNNTKQKRVPSSVLATTSSPRFDVYGNDFGFGRPLALRGGPGSQFDGRVWASAGADHGSIALEVFLTPQALWALAKDAEFFETLA